MIYLHYWHINYMNSAKGAFCIFSGFEDIRGFVSNGFSEMNNKEGDLSLLVGERLCIQLEWWIVASIKQIACIHVLLPCFLCLSFCLYLCFFPNYPCPMGCLGITFHYWPQGFCGYHFTQSEWERHSNISL